MNEEIVDLSTRFRALKHVTAGFARAISVRGEWFDVVLLMREVSEISSQTFQAYSSSYLISSVWMNQVFAGLIFLNTVANTLVHYNLEEKVGLRRLYSTATDLALDFAWGFIIPGKIMFVYVSMFMKNHGSFTDEFNYSDTLQIKAILECNQFFMVSWLDAVTTTLPYLNMLSGLRSIKFLIQHDMDVVTLTSRKIQPSGPPCAKLNSADLAREPTKTPKSDKHPIEIKRSVCGRRITTSIVALMPLFGVLILLTSIASTGVFFGEDSCAVGCKLRMHPWFTRQCACSVMEINCYERGIAGREIETQAILQSLDPRVLNSLIFSHCPELVITKDIRRFNNLMTLELYNATVLSWPSIASLSLPYVPYLTTILIVRSRLIGGIPEGLTSDLSPNVVDVEFIATDLGGPLPDNIDEKWPAVLLLYFEHCGLQEFPSAMARMTLTDVSLVDNNISMIPEVRSLSETFMYVMLDRNPLDQIPDSFESLNELFFLTVQHTNIASLPSWLQVHDGSLNFRATGTPYCDTLPPNSPEAAFAWCRTEDYSNGIFPLDMRDAERAIH